MKSIGIIGSRGYIEDVAFMTAADAMKNVGNNTGNLVFQYAVNRILTEEKLFIGLDLPWDVKTIRERCRVLVVPSANFIRENFDLTVFVDFLDKVNLPLVFLGLGAQADNYDKSVFDFHPSIHRLLSLIKERSKKVAIRGDFTARVLERHGITNAEVTGCPSNFINPSVNLPEMIASKLARPLRSFITHGDEPWPANKQKQLVERRLVEWTMQGSAIQSQQSVPVFMNYIRKGNPFSNGDIGDHIEESLRKALMPDATVEQFLNFIAVKLRVYFSASQWIEDSSKFDFSLGLRLHGNMVAWQSGTPALWIYHDSRTQELAETMALPKIALNDFLENCSCVEDAWSRVEFDKEAYRNRRSLLAKRMSSVLAAEEISHNLGALSAEL